MTTSDPSLQQKPKTVTITLSDRRPVKLVARDWPVIASASGHDGKVACQANREWTIRVRQHEDGRRVVYGWEERGDGGMPIGWESSYGGFLVDAVNGAPDEDETVRSIRRVAGIIGHERLGDDCIGSMPEEEMA